MTKHYIKDKKNKELKEEKLSIDLSIFLFIIYTVFILISDYFCFILKNANVKFLNYVLAFIVLIIVYFFIRKKIKIRPDNFNRIDIVFYVFLLIVLLLRVAIPDSAYDTLNYHLYLQQNPFVNNVSYNFFPSRWINTFTLPLPDRMHYFFRLILGYRVGMILNLFCLIVVYYQTKKILRYIFRESKETIISIFSMIILITEQILSNMITYYVDLLVLPLILEIIIVLMDQKQNKYNNYYVLLIGGLAISFKISNGFIILFLAILYIIKYRKNITYKTFLFGIPIFIFPFMVYLLNNYLQTGNPVFPFYNSIFKSQFLPLDNWMETFYGPKTIVEKIFWPIYTMIDPRRCFDTSTYYGRIAYGYIVSIAIILIGFYTKLVKKEKFDDLTQLAFLNFGLSLIWSNFMMGYIRYALVLEVLGGILSIGFIYKYFFRNHFYFVLSTIVVFSVIYVTICTCSDLFKSNTELSWRIPYTVDDESYSHNFKKIFKRDYDYNSLLENVSCIGITDNNSGYAILLGTDIPIINLNEGYANDFGKEKMQEVLNNCKNIYTIATDITYDRTIENINRLGYTQTGKINSGKVEFVNYDNELMLIEISK